MRKPKGFRAAEGVTNAVISETRPSFIRPANLKGKFKKGLEYEAQGHEMLAELFSTGYKPSPWFRFTDSKDKGRWCQPDGLLFDHERNRITIVEFKLKHCARAWWQLHKLYLPVVRNAYGAEWEICLLEICKWYDPATPFEGEVNRVRDLEFLEQSPVTNIFYYKG